jgi:2-polyprenyl-6-methoxyphenol hydroxylase-like FAD-dependent oxidoreductase
MINKLAESAPPLYQSIGLAGSPRLDRPRILWGFQAVQFHLNGFQTGDPTISPPASSAVDREAAAAGQPPTEVDVLIVGCGPAGLTLAAQLSAFPDIETCIVEQKAGPLQLGQADGVACRTMEMFNAFGFAHELLQEAYWVNETTFWRPSETNPENITRGGRVYDTEEGLSEFPHVILNQARVHEFYLEAMRKSPRRLEPFYSRRLISLEVEAHDANDESAFPVTARFEHTMPNAEPRIEIVRARYAVGCDGARSQVRQSLGLQLKGDSANQAWGVMDILAVTDFPDIRFKAIINSADKGSVVLIPREGGYLVRIYVEMDKLGKGKRFDRKDIALEHIIDAAQRVFHPFTIDVRDVAWWSVYEIGQRICDRFDDVPEEQRSARTPRVFIAGDACHTHSPKAGQGMNVSMQDAFNLGWKLGAVLERRAAPSLLHSYSAERQVVAKELIDFDREWATMLSRSAQRDPATNEPLVSPEEVQRYFVQHGRYTAGTAVRYRPSLLTGPSSHQDLASGFLVGERFHSATVFRLADGKPVHLGHTVEADGRWRLMIFASAADVAAADAPFRRLCAFLDEDEDSPVRRFTPKRAANDAVIDTRVVLQQAYREVDIAGLPRFLFPAKGRFGLTDYEKVFCADPREDIFDVRGIDRAAGCMVVVRPDQFVAHVLPLDATAKLADFFGSFMIEPSAGRKVVEAV